MRCEMWKLRSVSVMPVPKYHRVLTGRIEDETNVGYFGVTTLECEFEFGGRKNYAVLSNHVTPNLRNHNSPGCRAA